MRQAFYREDLIAPGKRFPSNRLVNDNSIERGVGAPDPTAQAQARAAIGSLRVVVVKPGGGTMEKGGTRWEIKARRIRTRLGNRR